jgi:hypothetical protein
MARLRAYVPFLVTGLVAGLVVATGPSVARAAREVINADKVDGKSAVSAGASPDKRAGKLVATDRNGRLPDDVIQQAPDAAKLGGKSPAAFAAAAHDHDPRYYSKSQIDARVSQRLVAVGVVDGSTGAVVPAYTSGPVTGTKANPDIYSLTVPGLRPGCTGNQPLLMGTPSFVSVVVTTSSVACSNGSFVQHTFNFAIYAPPPA